MNITRPPLELLTHVDIPANFLCPICKNIISNAHQADDCGCKYCYDCLTKFLETDKKCIKCSFIFSSHFKIPDKYFQNKIDTFQVSCSNKDCEWRGTMGAYSTHYNSHFATNQIE